MKITCLALITLFTISFVYVDEQSNPVKECSQQTEAEINFVEIELQRLEKHTDNNKKGNKKNEGENQDKEKRKIKEKIRTRETKKMKEKSRSQETIQMKKIKDERNKKEEENKKDVGIQNGLKSTVLMNYQKQEDLICYA
ncbi:hypothetical protein TTHERM_000383599 (macronuclear) [Tetrahymena thermophila SB210]|uniref:Transmembrane protein n=1 Tax=Tetrahymena thermophila (strain SB210) TaxID=312017 RepID=W7X559_TETTS|nr:hypothetical protein TTHERM_000383599 [Tetrahymena thermophila SB210]EWS74505.1 hypothetical protein TTHERM_000383599 [Tetrahymena thermophila SB210]|eukprot:XP_012652990.1 hypothetical protein TTHERM_000383599 [Tetrahymena thermophila SB210]